MLTRDGQSHGWPDQALQKHHLEGLDGLQGSFQAKSFVILYSLVFQWTSQAISQTLLLIRVLNIWGKGRKFPSAVSFETLYMVSEDSDDLNLHALPLCEQESTSWDELLMSGLGGVGGSVTLCLPWFCIFQFSLCFWPLLKTGCWSKTGCFDWFFDCSSLFF